MATVKVLSQSVGARISGAGANLAGIVNVFGVDAKKRIKSCEFHFKDLRNKRAQRLDTDSAKEFKTLCDELMRPTTVAAYEAAKRQLDTFLAPDSDREFLTTWISWWHERRGFIFHAFAPTNAPTMNQAEVVHAGWANRDRPNMSLLDACHADVRDSLLVEMGLQGLQSGSTTTGRGPTFADHNRERHRREVDRAKRLGKEMFAADQADISDGLCIDPKSSHRPKTQRKNSKKTNQPKEKVANNAVELSNAMPVQTSQIPCQPVHTAAYQQAPAHQQYQQHLFQQLPYPQQSVDYNPTGPVLQPTHNCSYNDQHGASSIGQMHMPGTQMHPLAPLPASPQVMWHSGMSTNKYEFVLLESCVKKCYGCGVNFADKHRRPPCNLVVKHIDRRVLGKSSLTGQLLYSNDFSNTYYHPVASHIQRINPVFTGTVYISSVLYYSLDTDQ